MEDLQEKYDKLLESYNFIHTAWMADQEIRDTDWEYEFLYGEELIPEPPLMAMLKLQPT